MEGMYVKLNQVAGVMGVQQTMVAQGVGNLVPTFSGRPQEFTDWIKSLEKCVLLTGVDPATTKHVAFQMAKGVVSNFIGRQIRNSLDELWAELKRQLTKRFGEIRDEHHAFALLQKCKQR